MSEDSSAKCYEKKKKKKKKKESLQKQTRERYQDLSEKQK